MTVTDSKQINIFWFRRDLRLEDNNALFHALNSGEEVLPIFIFDKLILDKLSKDDARVTFIHELLEKTNSGLQKQSKSLAVFYSDPETVWKQLITKHHIKSVFINRDYEPYARERDQKIYDLLQSKNIVLKSYKDQVIFERNDIIKADGSPYVVYTPFSKKWKEKFREIKLENFSSEKLLHQISSHSYPFLSLNEIGFLRSNIKVVPFNISANFAIPRITSAVLVARRSIESARVTTLLSFPSDEIASNKPWPIISLLLADALASICICPE